MSESVPYLGLMPGAFEVDPNQSIEPAFPEQEYRARLHRVRIAMAEQKIDLLWVTMPEHVCYLHGFCASWYKANSPMRYPQLYGTAVHVDSDELVHFNNPTELPLLAKYSVLADNRFFPSREASPNIAFIIGELRAKGWLRGTIGLEYWSYLPNRAISTMLEGAFLAEGCRVVDGSSLLRKVRRIKSALELAYIEKAVALADIGHDAVRRKMRADITELELFGEVMRDMLAAGSELPALIPIFNAVPVRNGRSMTTGHAMAGRKKLAPGEMLKADLCGVYNRYHGNVMRGYYLGEPSQALLDQHRRAAGVFSVFSAEVKAGMTVREVNAVLQRYYKEVGLWDEPGWALGYELGLSLPPDWVGEFYFHFRDDKYLDRVFEENMVTNLESLFGTWFVDTCVYEKNGARFLSRCPLELIAIC
jgi:Xaa-Pro aminopeptidase